MLRVSETTDCSKVCTDVFEKPSHALIIVSYLLEHIKVLEEKFGKMKEVYSNLREEHIDLLRKVSACPLV